jgi:hypothetical protein
VGPKKEDDRGPLRIQSSLWRGKPLISWSHAPPRPPPGTHIQQHNKYDIPLPSVSYSYMRLLDRVGAKIRRHLYLMGPSRPTRRLGWILDRHKKQCYGSKMILTRTESSFSGSSGSGSRSYPCFKPGQKCI